ncbi:PP2C family protein-serine/threonine phosphatase [Sporosarcina sp. G11-34]|uniref:PP2C family protein-serine/threonine phosphatase n=1 Tax=Sporosarcina sp. G11-34 TaxID=2849605 RepID=UPI0022A972E7|nr:PP2C family protein-serine/threonine phosphatase [Sporosarcina sp. G11-34]MCZ2260424.1 PP2C family protein-serine/threonine phosphatase [Sporosarcina sp. G11-34]
MPSEVEKQYEKVLERYVAGQSEKDLYDGQKFSREFIEQEISPEDVISIHKTALEDVLPNMPEELWHSFDFLIEMMIHYGLALKEHQSLVRKREELEVEMNVAARVQEMLLKTEIPDFPVLDIGFVSIPAERINGDYIYFVSDDNYASVAVADVMGKGIPAALCMSMIKFGMDSLQIDKTCPYMALEMINRIVEKSIDDSMFISMFFGRYNAQESIFSYASAGHEPAILYTSSTNEFTELNAKGLLLGVQSNVVYEERSVVLEDGDFIVMMTDGVTETRTADGFIDEECIKSILLEAKYEPAQAIADFVYKTLVQMQNFQLRDDFTIVIFKKDDKKV